MRRARRLGCEALEFAAMSKALGRLPLHRAQR